MQSCSNYSQDLCFKLVVLSWEDWSPEVRQAAAIALGQTGHAKVRGHRLQCHCIMMCVCVIINYGKIKILL